MITGESDYQCNLETKAADVSALLSENTDKYEFFTSEDVLPETGMLKKPSAIIKKKWIIIIGSWVEKTNSHSKKTISRIIQGMWIW